MNRVIAASAAPLERLRPALLRHRWLGFVLAMAALPVTANTFNVDSAGDGDQAVGNTTTCSETGNTSHCSLRAAISLGNNITGPHIININVPAITIINGAMSQMRAQFVLNGNAATIIGGGHGCLNLTDAGTDSAALNIHNGNGANGSTITNLSIGGCSGDGIAANGHGYTFSNNRIGVNYLGVLATPNTGHGISLSASAAYQSQFIDVAGLQSLYNALPAQPIDSSQISSFSVNIATALQNLNPNKITGNTISGNQLNGIEIFSQNLAATIISSNFIGTDITGNVAIANGGNGIHLTGDTFANLIGPANVISGNTQNGVQVDAGAVYLPNFIMGNRIGLASAIGNHVGNGGSGIVVNTKPDTTAGHFNPSSTALIVGPANVISDNKGANNNAFPDQLGTNAGVLITGSSTGIKLLGNTIGLAEFPAGTPINSTQYGNKGDGVIVTTSGNKIGGSGATDGNIVAGNARHGIVVSGSATTSNSILGNSIGVSPAFAGNLTLGNGVDGVHIDAASSTTIGGAGTTDFNTVVANGRNGIKIRNGGSTNGWSNLSQRNRIYHNASATGGIGLDLDYTENAVNALHGEFPNNYANLDQAQPVICNGPADTGACSGSTAPSSSAGSTTVQWTLTTHGPANFRMEFFQINAADDNSATNMAFLGEQLVSTDVTGGLVGATCTSTRCTVTLPVSTGGSYVLMTANDITPLTNQPGGGTDWKSNLTCFIGDLGVILSSCNVNNSSEFSNVATIPASAPSVSTQAASNITTTTATLSGTVNDNGAATAISLEYGPDTSYGTVATAIPSSLAAGAGSTAITGPISGLTCGSTYHFRIKASNGVGGIVFGGDLTFTAAACAATPPTAASVAASAISATAATLNGTVSSNGANTTVSFDYGPTASYGTNVAATQSPLSSGASNAAVSVALSGLTCNTTYHFRVNATNSAGGPIHGSDLTFNTAICAAIAPTTASNAANSITATSAVLNGTVSANGAATNATFDFGTTTAYGALGSPTTATQSPLTSGASNAPVSVTITGLACNTLYHFRANANNGIGGTVNGSDLTFTTGACAAVAPTVTTLAATSITTTTATLNGTVTANGASTAVTFDYGATTSYGTNVAAAQSPLASNASNASVTYAVSGLTCGQTYHFRVNANNGVGGTINGADLTFNTAVCAAVAPAATTNAATSITTTSALLNGTVSANGASATVVFNYGPTNAYGSSINATQSPLSSGSSNAPVSAALSGLTCNTLYHFRVTANNGVGGTINGSDLTFTTSACPGVPPTATTAAATSLTPTGATVNGTVTANGASTTVNFDYGPTTSYGSNAAAAQSPLTAAANDAPVSAALTGLTCNSTYHFRANGNNGTGGTIHGADLTFTTSACPALAPTATTNAASAITANSATLNGTVSANGATTTVMFEYGTTAAYGSSLAATQSPLGSGASNAAVSVNATALVCGTLYHFRVDANNGVGGTILGADQTFTTAACPVIKTFNGPTFTGTGTATAVLSGGGASCSFVAPAFVGSPAALPPGVSFPDGLFSFTATGCSGTITLTVTFPTAFVASEQYWKYGPTPGNAAPHWYTLTAANNNVSLAGNVATFTISDGSFGDDDLTVNGTIVDQGGPGVTAPPAQAAMPAPALNLWGMLGLATLLGLFAAMHVRGLRMRMR